MGYSVLAVGKIETCEFFSALSHISQKKCHIFWKTRDISRKMCHIFCKTSCISCKMSCISRKMSCIFCKTRLYFATPLRSTLTDCPQMLPTCDKLGLQHFLSVHDVESTGRGICFSATQIIGADTVRGGTDAL